MKTLFTETTMQYLCLIYSTPDAGPQPGEPEFGAYMQAFIDATEAMKKGGVYVSGEALESATTATTVTKENGKLETMDGPFAETKEQLGGFYLIDCKDLDEAIKYAAMIPTVEHGRVEVRPVMALDL